VPYPASCSAYHDFGESRNVPKIVNTKDCPYIFTRAINIGWHPVLIMWEEAWLFEPYPAFIAMTEVTRDRRWYEEFRK
jgi:hypothetical protein